MATSTAKAKKKSSSAKTLRKVGGWKGEPWTEADEKELRELRAGAWRRVVHSRSS